MAWTIGQLARQAAVSVETIKFYQRRGLLEVPVASGPAGRLYSEDMLKRMKFIRFAKTLQFSLREIGMILDLYDRRDGMAADVNIREIIKEKTLNLDRQIETFRKVREVLTTLVDGDVSADPIDVFARLADITPIEVFQSTPVRMGSRRKT